MKWLNEPRTWSETADGLVLRTDPKTDFWRITHDGGVRDNGHFYYETVEGDFGAEVFLEGDFSDLYDQAGLMFRLDEKNWMKCGIEYFEGQPCRSVVVTRDFSDWSIMPPRGGNRLWIRAMRAGQTVEVSISDNGEDYSIFRQAYLSDSGPLQIGYMAASPAGEGFEARFHDFRIG